MCFALLWFQYVLVMLIALLLLINRVIGLCCRSAASSKNDDNHIAYWTALNTAIYSASVIDVATVSWHFVNHDTGPPLT